MLSREVSNKPSRNARELVAHFQNERYRTSGKGFKKRGHINNAVSIDERVAIVEWNIRIGDWKIDTVIR